MGTGPFLSIRGEVSVADPTFSTIHERKAKIDTERERQGVESERARARPPSWTRRRRRRRSPGAGPAPGDQPPEVSPLSGFRSR
jgi:hypothetical protein